MKTIAVLGSGGVKPDSPIYQAAQEVGRLLAGRGFAVATGAYGGVMEAAAKGAKEAGGQAIGYTMWGKKGNDSLTQTVNCQTLYCNAALANAGSTVYPEPEVQYGIRLGSLMLADGFVIVAGGGPGTMVELMTIINLNQKLWRKKPKRLAILTAPGTKSGCWNDGMLDQLIQWEVLPPAVTGLIIVAATPDLAAQWVTTQPTPQ